MRKKKRVVTYRRNRILFGNLHVSIYLARGVYFFFAFNSTKSKFTLIILLSIHHRLFKNGENHACGMKYYCTHSQIEISLFLVSISSAMLLQLLPRLLQQRAKWSQQQVSK